MYLIDRGKLLMQMMHKFHYELPDGCNNPLYGDVMKVIEDAPLIEAEPVRYGRWIHTDLAAHWHGKDKCSECTYHEKDRSDLSHLNFCPNCGCKMSKEE